MNCTAYRSHVQLNSKLHQRTCNGREKRPELRDDHPGNVLSVGKCERTARCGRTVLFTWHCDAAFFHLREFPSLAEYCDRPEE